MKILVTGATGFIGRHLVKQLHDLEYDIIATAIERKEEASKILSSCTKIEYISKNLSDQDIDYFKLFGKPEKVIHLSWAGLPNYMELFHIEKNLPENYYFLKNMIEHGLSDITILGTCFEYGLQNGCLHEELDTRPATVYGLAKDCLRKFIQCLQDKYPFQYKWIRLFYPYGTGQGEKSLYSQMINAISSNSKEFNMSQGDQIRDYITIEKTAEYIALIALQNEINGIINCCSGKPISVRNFVENFFAKSNYSIKLNLGYYPYAAYEPFSFWGDTEKLMKIIGSNKT